ADQHGRSTLLSDHLDGDSRWSELADVRTQELTDCLGVLVGYEPKTELRPCLAGQDSLGPGSGVAAEESVHVAGGASPLPLERGVAFLSHHGRHGQIGLEFG